MYMSVCNSAVIKLIKHIILVFSTQIINQIHWYPIFIKLTFDINQREHDSSNFESNDPGFEPCRVQCCVFEQDTFTPYMQGLGEIDGLLVPPGKGSNLLTDHLITG